MSSSQTTNHGPKPSGDQGQHSTNLLEVDPTECDDESVCSCHTDTENRNFLQYQETPNTQTLSASFRARMMEFDFYLKEGQVGDD